MTSMSTVGFFMPIIGGLHILIVPLGVTIVGTPPPPTPYERGEVGPSKNLVTWGVPNILLERGNNPENGTVQLHLLSVG